MTEGFADPVVAAGVAALVDGYRTRRFDPARACAAYLDRIRSHDGRLGAFVALDDARARRDADASAARYASGSPRGPLDGVPIGVKANVAVAGLPWTAGIGAWRDRIAAHDAGCVAALRDAGVVVLGTLNMDEAALGAATDNPWFGRTTNPHRPGASAGGSSGGAAAAVAAGLCAAALATDTMGSVRIPAAYCGVCGLVPVATRIARDGVWPLAPRHDRVGWIARSVADGARLLDAARDHAPPNDAGRPPRVAALSPSSVDDDGRAAYRDAIARVAAAGTTIEWIPPGFYAPRAAARALLIDVEVEAHAIHATLLARPDADLSAVLRAMLEWGGRVPPARADAVRAALAAIDRDVRAALAPYHALLLPTTPGPAFDFVDGAPDDAASFTSLASIAGLSAATVPTAVDARGLPLALQVVATTDRVAVAIAAAVERASIGVAVPAAFRD